MNVSKKSTRAPDPEAPDSESSARRFFHIAHLNRLRPQSSVAPPDEAVEWFVANREPLSAAQRKAFVRWLKQSPTHVEAYLHLAKLAGDIGKAAADSDSSVDELIKWARASKEGDDFTAAASPELRRVPVARGLRFAAALALAVVCGTWLWNTPWWVNLLPDTAAPGRLSTQHGEQLTHRLADGSVLHLNTDTSVSVSYSAENRSMKIERGQAEFEVAHDPARPFRVIAGSAEVVAAGTKFDVYLQPGETLVTVIEGIVTVGETPRPDGAVNGESAAKEPIQVRAGEQFRVLPGGTSVPSPVDTQAATAWLRRQLVFQGEPLAAAAAEFNRYSSTPIEIGSAALRGLAISGVFGADDTESFVTFLRALDGVRVEVTATKIRVLQK